MYSAVCPDCSAHIHKIPSATDCDIIEDCRNPNTTKDQLHEANSKVPGGIWIKEDNNAPAPWFANDRIIYNWLIYANRYDDKTVDRHLSAIRFCENITEGKDFSSFTVEDLSKVRNDLKRRARADAEGRLSPSTIKHIASHLAAFFEWLLKQDGFKRLPKDLPDYCKLPRATFSAALPRAVKAYPTIGETEEMLFNMPSRTINDRRARALFALAFLGALRADTLVSLKIQHFDIPNRRIIQDGTAVRSKNGKSAYITWFPIPKIFENEVIAWAQILTEKGFRQQDPLFPSSTWLGDPQKVQKVGRAPIPVMSTKHAASDAFLRASQTSGIKYTPHDSKHAISGARDAKHLTHKQRKAWSENMGHEHERITETHYARFSDVQRAEVLESIEENKPGNTLELSKDEQMLIEGLLTRFRKVSIAE
ncbi:tyrosine-type recombinase/integrase [Falsihalocynthiibacter sp. CO-5D18]|uniref:tyrosine-type recombinase/integrase n=1 Tax=Falsihalocynthiibacter sp. CO-5D18 TaxID=3240872 RepID=UPI00350F1F5A